MLTLPLRSSEAISPEPQFEHYETVKKPSPPKKITIKLLAEDQVKVIIGITAGNSGTRGQAW